MDCEFVIPLKKEDCLEQADGQYVAKIVDITTAYKKLGGNIYFFLNVNILEWFYIYS